MCVYILKSLKDNKHYVGMTSCLEKRLTYHNAGRVKSTKNRVPFIMIYNEKYETIKETRERENIRPWSRRQHMQHGELSSTQDFYIKRHNDFNSGGIRGLRMTIANVATIARVAGISHHGNRRDIR